jgi:hypothetical protein
MQSKLALRPFQLTVNDSSQSVPHVIHTAMEKSRSYRGFQVSLIADPGHTLGPHRPNLFWQKSFLPSDLVLYLIGAASRWYLDRFGGMVGYSAKMAQLLRPKRRQLRAACPVTRPRSRSGARRCGRRRWRSVTADCRST